MEKINLLNATNIAVPTDATKRLNIKGTVKNYQVCKINIDSLYYNNQNDRIASEISEYCENKGIDKFDVNYDNLNEYNDIVAEFIKSSNFNAFEKTKSNIERFGQLEAGVVTSDGRIIDGNRRFTCIRELSKTNPDFGYFNAVILDQSEISEKEIKRLELEIQIGAEEKVEYHIIDRCAGVYRDLIKEGHLFTKQEYASITDEKEKDIEALMDKTNLFIEFLDYINAPEKFHIAKQLEIDGPISELIPLKRNKTPEDWDKIKKICFDNILGKTDRDITRFIRNIKKYAKDEKLNKYFADHESKSKQISDILEKENVTSDVIKEKIRGNEVLIAQLKDDYKKHIINEIEVIEKIEPLEKARAAYAQIDNIDKDKVTHLKQEDKDTYLKLLSDLADLLDKKIEEANV